MASRIIGMGIPFSRLNSFCGTVFWLFYYGLDGVCRMTFLVS